VAETIAFLLLHSWQERKAFEPAEEAYEHYLEVLEECRKQFEEQENESK
jgi:hypothetical protein